MNKEKDKIVIDIETKNTFFEVGSDNFSALEISLVGLYSYNRGEYLHFFEDELEKVAEFLKNAGLIIGFSISRFDLPVLKNYFSKISGFEDFDIFTVPRFDLLDEIEFSMGRRIGLDMLARHNLGIGKNGLSLDAPILFQEGKMEELKNYCLNDVKITKDLYELSKRQGYLTVPQKNSAESLRVDICPALF